MIRPPEEQVPFREEGAKLLAEIPERYRGLFAPMVKYGLRKSEAFNLRAGDYNIERRILTITGKGGRVRHIPLVDPDSHAELQTRTENAIEGWLCYSPRNQGAYADLRSTLKSAAKRADRLRLALEKHHLGED